MEVVTELPIGVVIVAMIEPLPPPPGNTEKVVLVMASVPTVTEPEWGPPSAGPGSG